LAPNHEVFAVLGPSVSCPELFRYADLHFLSAWGRDQISKLLVYHFLCSLAGIHILGLVFIKEFMIGIGVMRKKKSKKTERGAPKQYAILARKLMKIPWLLSNI
jgi:hypothetical protein